MPDHSGQGPPGKRSPAAPQLASLPVAPPETDSAVVPLLLQRRDAASEESGIIRRQSLDRVERLQNCLNAFERLVRPLDAVEELGNPVEAVGPEGQASRCIGLEWPTPKFVAERAEKVAVALPERRAT